MANARTMSTWVASLFTLLLILSLLLAPIAARAAHDGTCHPPDGTPLSGDQVLVIFLGGNPATPSQTTSVHLSAIRAALSPAGDTLRASFTGTVQVTDGLSNTYFIGEDVVHSTCADNDGDGLVGLTSLSAEFRNARTGELVPVMFQPATEIDADGVYTIAVTIGTQVTVILDVRARLTGTLG